MSSPRLSPPVPLLDGSFIEQEIGESAASNAAVGKCSDHARVSEGGEFLCVTVAGRGVLEVAVEGGVKVDFGQAWRQCLDKALQAARGHRSAPAQAKHLIGGL